MQPETIRAVSNGFGRLVGFTPSKPTMMAEYSQRVIAVVEKLEQPKVSEALRNTARLLDNRRQDTVSL